MTAEIRDASLARQAAWWRQHRWHPVLKTAAVVGGLATAALASAMSVLWVTGDRAPWKHVRPAIAAGPSSWLETEGASKPAATPSASAPTVTALGKADDPPFDLSTWADSSIMSLAADVEEGEPGMPPVVSGGLAPFQGSSGVAGGLAGGGTGAFGSRGSGRGGAKGGGGSGSASGTAGGGAGGSPGPAATSPTVTAAGPPAGSPSGGSGDAATPAAPVGTPSPNDTASGPSAPAPTGGGNPAPAAAPAGAPSPTVTASGPPAASPTGGGDRPAPAAAPQPPSPLIIADGPVEGFGPIAGPVTVVPGGILAPGASPGVMTLDDDFRLAGGKLEIDIWGYDPGDDYDVLNVTGKAFFDSGVIEFVFTNDETGVAFAPEVGSTFTFFNAAEGIQTFKRDLVDLVSLDLPDYSLVGKDPLDFIVINDGWSLTLEIVRGNGDEDDVDLLGLAAGSARTPAFGAGSTFASPALEFGTAFYGQVFQVAQVSAPGTLLLQAAGSLLVLGGVAVRRRRQATERRIIG